MSGKNILLIFLLLCFTSLYSQNSKKIFKIDKTDAPPTIDGVLDDKIWQQASIATDFVQYKPYNNEPSSEKTEVRMLYDDNFIYLGAILYDNNPDSIFTTLSKRDGGFDVDADMFILSLGTFNDGINTNRFVVTAAGVQSDIKGSSGDDDSNWDVVWKSAVSINNKGWVVEMAIPYSALRFPNKDEQVWDVNFFRKIFRKQELSSWNWIDNKIDGFSNQSGVLTGIKGVKAPLRLSLTPYLSTFLEHNSENNNLSGDLKGGLDLKYGINESFTLDMMLIPDFSQVQSDDIELNLSAFETKYEEKRPFFTEGTELFEKGDIFYSKRIGSFPKDGWTVYDNLGTNEEVVSNPSETQIVNASKVTGRTKKGLGIGLFNTITLKTVATIEDTVTQQEREYETQPLTNYNVIVFDQNLKNNSYVSVINTNVLMPDNKYTANVTAGEFLLKNKKQSYEVNGSMGVSQIYNSPLFSEYGYKHFFELSKTSGNVRFTTWQELIDDKFNPNDMGFLWRNNYMETGAEIRYQILQPYKNLLNWFIELNNEYQNQYNTLNFIQWHVRLKMSSTFKNQWRWRIFTKATPLGTDDYYEPRQNNRVYKQAPEFEVGSAFDSDKRKKLFLHGFAMYRMAFSQYDENMISFTIEPSWRVNNKLNLSLNIEPNFTQNDIGYVDNVSNIIYFGKRDRRTIINSIVANVAFNEKMSLSLRCRHYWATAEYNRFYQLNNDGTLKPDDTFNSDDINFNAFNIDFVYTWRFAPGSDLIFVWKNAIYNSGDNIEENYWGNLNNTLNSPQSNLISIKALYYLDYAYVKKYLKK
jgi:hypothetical protein